MGWQRHTGIVILCLADQPAATVIKAIEDLASLAEPASLAGAVAVLHVACVDAEPAILRLPLVTEKRRPHEFLFGDRSETHGTQLR
jgi:hypothetical protein